MLKLVSDRLKIELRHPLDDFYRGTRFDHSGIFAGAQLCGVEMAAPWFENYSPVMHDAVQGPAEDFSQIGFDAAVPGDVFLKPGVGLLRRPDDAPYDRFRLYEIAEAGAWEVWQDGTKGVGFSHELAGWYKYVKYLLLTGPEDLCIRHSLTALDNPLAGNMYNHNFWTFGNLSVGRHRLLDFPFKPRGHWRAEYDSVALTDSGIRFNRGLQKGETVFMGDLAACGQESVPYDMEMSEGDISVAIRCDVPASHIVFWANHRIACLEPYIRYDLAPGRSFHWEIRYHFTARR